MIHLYPHTLTTTFILNYKYLTFVFTLDSCGNFFLLFFRFRQHSVSFFIYKGGIYLIRYSNIEWHRNFITAVVLRFLTGCGSWAALEWMK